MLFRETLRTEYSYLYSQALREVETFENTLQQGDLSAKEVLRAHFCIVEHFTEEGSGLGGAGPKDLNLLLAALSRQHVGYGSERKWTSVQDKAATLLYGMIMNHPFYDANKRTAYLSTIHYLYRSGYIITMSHKDLEDMTVHVAENRLDKFPRFREMRKKGDDPEVRFLSHFLKKNTRRIDRKQYLLTYRELSKVLKKYDVWLENPNNNFIDVMRWEEVEHPGRGLFARKTTTNEVRRVCSLGFPGWSKSLEQGRLKHLRTELGLTPENGVDSQSFFKDVDDMQALLNVYEGALRRLADR